MAVKWTKIKDKDLYKGLFSEPVLCTALSIIAGHPKDFNDYMIDRFNQDLGCNYQAIHVTLEEDNKTLLIINIPNKDKSPETLSLLSHELVHFVFQCFREKGIAMNKSNEEMFAYLYSFYMKKIYESLSEVEKPVKKLEKTDG